MPGFIFSGDMIPVPPAPSLDGRCSYLDLARACTQSHNRRGWQREKQGHDPSLLRQDDRSTKLSMPLFVFYHRLSATWVFCAKAVSLDET